MRQPASQPAEIPAPDRAARRSTRIAWSLGAAAALSIVASITVWAASRGPDPRPGIRQATWQRAMDLTPPGAERTTTKFYVRSARTYLGPPPPDDELERYRAAGRLDAFLDYVREPWQQQIRAALADIEQALDASGNAADDAIAAAKERLRGSDDVLVVDDPRDEATRERVAAFRRAASAAKEMCVSGSVGGVQHLYRLRRERCPEVYELRVQDAEINRVRAQHIHDHIAALLAEHGRGTLDEARMRETWAGVLERASR